MSKQKMLSKCSFLLLLAFIFQLGFGKSLTSKHFFLFYLTNVPLVSSSLYPFFQQDRTFCITFCFFPKMPRSLNQPPPKKKIFNEHHMCVIPEKTLSHGNTGMTSFTTTIAKVSNYKWIVSSHLYNPGDFYIKKMYVYTHTYTHPLVTSNHLKYSHVVFSQVLSWLTFYKCF